jgi:hypothetical protein
MNLSKSKILIFLLLCLTCLASSAQIPTSSFRTHLNYANARGVVLTDNYAYCHTSNGFYRITKGDSAVELLDKKNGLSEMNVTAAYLRKSANQLCIGYKSGTIDIINLTGSGEFEGITSIDFIKRASGISADKEVNKIIDRGDRAYVATAFGLVEIDLERRQVRETYRNIGPNGISVEVHDILIKNDSLFLSTSAGILGGSLSPSVNLLFFGNWQLIQQPDLFKLPNLPTDIQFVTEINDIAVENGVFWIADENNGLITNVSGNWKSIIPDGLPEGHGYFFKENSKVGFIGKKGYIFESNNWNELPRPFPVEKSVIIDRFGNQWELINTTLRVTSNGRTFNFSQFNGLSGQPTDIALDRDDLLWITTTNGVTVIPTTSNFANNPVDPFTPVFGNQRLLLQQIVNAVEVDGGNRKWFGTNGGLYCFSPETDRLIHFFDIENSLLLDNQIIDLRVNATGELFILSQNGIISYQTDAAKPEESLNNITLFPNPIRPNFEGVFTVKGLPFDSNIKITAPDGRVIHTGFSNGGIATWDLRLPSGDRTSSGIYLIFVLNDSFTEKFVGKVAVIR